MKKSIVFIISLIITAILIAATVSVAAGNIIIPPPEDLLVPVEYDSKELSPEEAEMLKNIEGTFLLKMIEMPWNLYIKAQYPVEAIINKINRESKALYIYVFQLSDGTIEYYQYSIDRKAICQKQLEASPERIIKTAFREDLFKQVDITKEFDDIRVLETYCFYGYTSKCFGMIYFKTNHGDFIFHDDFSAGSITELLCPKDLFYEYDGNSTNMALAIDVTPYLIKVQSSTLPIPIPNTSDPSPIFAIMSVISAGGFTVFAAKKSKKKVTDEN